METTSCFRFERPSYTFDTSVPAPITLQATHALVHGTINASRLCDNLTIMVGKLHVNTSLVDANGELEMKMK